MVNVRVDRVRVIHDDEYILYVSINEEREDGLFFFFFIVEHGLLPWSLWALTCRAIYGLGKPVWHRRKPNSQLSPI